MHRLSERITAKAAIAVSCVLLCASVGQAATITVNSLADDAFPNGPVGAIVDINGAPIALASPKCTLRMAMASANLNVAVGGGNGCAAGAAGADTIVFDAALFATAAGTITLANKGMSEAPAAFVPPLPFYPPLFASTPMTITGPGSAKLTIDGSVAAIDVRRLLGVSDADDNTAFQFNLSGVRLLRGRVVGVGGSGGCLASNEHVTVTDVVFESCEAVSDASDSGHGGAINVGVDASQPGFVRPNVTIVDSLFVGNRAIRGSSSIRSEAGAAALGGNGDKVGVVTITNTVFNGNSADTRGAMLIGDATSVAISGSHFIGNAATGSVAANTSGRNGGFLIVGVSGDVTISQTRVNGNVANEERAGFGIQSVGGTVTMNQVDVTGNYANRHRIGGFEVITDTFDATSGNCQGLQLRPVNMSHMRIEGNSVATSNGGFRVICSGAVTMTDVWIVGNETRGYRTGVADVVSTSNSAGQFSNATDGTAAGSTLSLTRVTVENNSTDATAGGGGSQVLVVTGLGSFTADSLRMINNFMSGSGGLSLAANGAGRNYVISNSEFSGNSSLGRTLFIQTDGNYTLRNSTVSGNVARTGPGSIGAIIAANANTNTASGINIAIEHSTIARNTAPFNEALSVFVAANQPNPGTVSGLYGGGNAAIAVKNSILGTRSPGYSLASTVSFDASVTNVTATNSLLEFSGGVPALAGFCAGTGMKCNVGSLVSPLTANGGASDTRTMALQAGSPAINAGGAVQGGLTTDQRGAGFARVIGAAVDMGAYESDPATTVGCTLDLDGNGTLDALTDGLLLIRALFGLTGTTATAGAIGPSPTRSDWTAIRNYLNANCGSGFAP